MTHWLSIVTHKSILKSDACRQYLFALMYERGLRVQLSLAHGACILRLSCTESPSTLSCVIARLLPLACCCLGAKSAHNLSAYVPQSERCKARQWPTKQKPGERGVSHRRPTPTATQANSLQKEPFGAGSAGYKMSFCDFN